MIYPGNTITCFLWEQQQLLSNAKGSFLVTLQKQTNITNVWLITEQKATLGWNHTILCLHPVPSYIYMYLGLQGKTIISYCSIFIFPIVDLIVASKEPAGNCTILFIDSYTVALTTFVESSTVAMPGRTWLGGSKQTGLWKFHDHYNYVYKPCKKIYNPIGDAIIWI